MLPNGVFVWGEVNAINLILGYVAVEPLNLRSYRTQSLQRAQGHLPDLHIGQRSGARYLAFDYKLRHSRHQNIIPLSRKEFVI